MKQGRMDVKTAELVDPYGSEFADPSKIIPQKVDDHDVFRTVFFAIEQVGSHFFVAGRVGPAWAGAFYRRGHYGAYRPRVLDGEELFGRRRDNERRPAVKVRGERRGVAAPQMNKDVGRQQIAV